MSNLIRYVADNKVQDMLSAVSNFVDINVLDTPSMLSTGISGLYTEGAMTFEASENIQINFTDEFTVCFWAKFIDKGNDDTVFGNVISLVFNNNVNLTVKIDESVFNTKHKFFVRITRDTNDLVEISIDGTIIASQTIADDFNLSDGSFIYIGTQNKHFTGYDIVLDDILLLDAKISYLDTVPTDYLELFKFYNLLYVEVATGNVYGYGV